MATVIGEVSGVLTFLEVGLSLATSLTTYIGDVQAAPEEVNTLAVEIEATLRLVEELDKLLKLNEQTKAWNETGIFMAQKCRTDSDKVVRKLLRLLLKSHPQVPTCAVVGRQDIDVTRFNRLQWPRFRPRLEVAKSELERTRIDILLARDLYNFGSARSSEIQKAQARENIKALAKSKQAAQRRLFRAKRRESSQAHVEGTAVESNQFGLEPSRLRRSPSPRKSLRQARAHRRHMRHGVDDYFQQPSSSESASNNDLAEPPAPLTEAELDAFRMRTREEIEKALDDEKRIRIQQAEEQAALRERLVQEIERERREALVKSERQAKEDREAQARMREEVLKEIQERDRKREEAEQEKLRIQEGAIEKYKAELAEKAAQDQQHSGEIEKLLKSFDDQLPDEDVRAFAERQRQVSNLDHISQAFSRVGVTPAAETYSHQRPRIASTRSVSDVQQATRPSPRWMPSLRRKSTIHSEVSSDQADVDVQRFVGLYAVYDDEEDDWDVVHVRMPRTWFENHLRNRKKWKHDSTQSEMLETFSKLSSGGRRAVSHCLAQIGGQHVTWTLVSARHTQPKIRKSARLVETLFHGVERGFSKPIGQFLLVYKASRDLYNARRKSVKFDTLAESPDRAEEAVAGSNVDVHVPEEHTTHVSPVPETKSITQTTGVGGPGGPYGDGNPFAPNPQYQVPGTSAPTQNAGAGQPWVDYGQANPFTPNPPHHILPSVQSNSAPKPQRSSTRDKVTFADDPAGLSRRGEPTSTAADLWSTEGSMGSRHNVREHASNNAYALDPAYQYERSGYADNGLHGHYDAPSHRYADYDRTYHEPYYQSQSAAPTSSWERRRSPRPYSYRPRHRERIEALPRYDSRRPEPLDSFGDRYYDHNDEYRRSKYEAWQSKASRRLDRMAQYGREESYNRHALGESTVTPNRGNEGRPMDDRELKGRWGGYYTASGVPQAPPEPPTEDMTSDADVDLLTSHNDDDMEQLSNMMIIKYTGAGLDEAEQDLTNGVADQGASHRPKATTLEVRDAWFAEGPQFSRVDEIEEETAGQPIVSPRRGLTPSPPQESAISSPVFREAVTHHGDMAGNVDRAPPPPPPRRAPSITASDHENALAGSSDTPNVEAHSTVADD